MPQTLSTVAWAQRAPKLSHVAALFYRSARLAVGRITEHDAGGLNQSTGVENEQD